MLLFGALYLSGAHYVVTLEVKEIKMKKQRYCTYCKEPIDSGFACDKCKKENLKPALKAAQKRYYEKHRSQKGQLEQLRKENEELKQKLQEESHAN